MEIFLQNLRYAYRQLCKSKIFALTAVLTLALGVGANTAIFTVVYSTVLAPMPYSQPDQLVMVWSKLQGHRNGVTAADFEDWKGRLNRDPWKLFLKSRQRITPAMLARFNVSPAK